LPVRSAGRDGGIVWLGLHEPNTELLAEIQAQLGLHELMIEDANQAHQRAKLDIYDNVLFIVLRTAQLDSKAIIQYGETHLIVGKGFVVSIRHGASASYAEVRQRCERNQELLRLGESAIMYAILDFVGDNYFPIIDQITGELEAIEEDIFSAMPARDKIERIYRLRAGLLNMRHAVAPMIEICNQLRRHDFPGRRGQPAALRRAAERYCQKARQLGRDPRGANGDRRHLRDELQKHAGAGVASRLSRVLVVDAGDLQYFYWCFRRAAWL
jgi:magnesium transporter